MSCNKIPAPRDQLEVLESQIQRDLADLCLSDRRVNADDLAPALGRLTLQNARKKCQIHDISQRMVWGYKAVCKEDRSGKLEGTESMEWKWTGYQWDAVAVKKKASNGGARKEKRSSRKLTPQQRVHEAVARDMERLYPQGKAHKYDRQYYHHKGQFTQHGRRYFLVGAQGGIQPV